MSEINVATATLDDWQDIKVLVDQLSASRFTNIVGANRDEASGFLLNSLVAPDGVGFLMLRWMSELIGMAALMAINAPKPGTLGVYAQCQRHCFINSVYIRPDIAGVKVPKEAGSHMLLGIEAWARARGAVWMYGNVRLDGRFGALWRKFGMAPQHGVAGKGVSSGLDDLDAPGFELHQVVVGKELDHG